MFKIIKKIVSLALIPVQLYFGYLFYKNLTAKQNSPVSTEIIKQEINLETANIQNEEDSAETNPGVSNAATQTDLPEGHPQINKNINLTPEATVNGLSIGQTTTSQAIAALGTPITIHQNIVFIYENINLYFQEDILNGFVFPGTALGFSEDTLHSPFKTSSGLTLGTPIQKVFEKYGSKKLNGKIIYQDRSNGYMMTISQQDNKIIAIEVGKK